MSLFGCCASTAARRSIRCFSSMPASLAEGARTPNRGSGPRLPPGVRPMFPRGPKDGNGPRQPRSPGFRGPRTAVASRDRNRPQNRKPRRPRNADESAGIDFDGPEFQKPHMIFRTAGEWDKFYETAPLGPRVVFEPGEVTRESLAEFLPFDKTTSGFRGGSKKAIAGDYEAQKDIAGKAIGVSALSNPVEHIWRNHTYPVEKKQSMMEELQSQLKLTGK